MPPPKKGLLPDFDPQMPIYTGTDKLFPLDPFSTRKIPPAKIQKWAYSPKGKGGDGKNNKPRLLDHWVGDGNYDPGGKTPVSGEVDNDVTNSDPGDPSLGGGGYGGGGGTGSGSSGSSTSGGNQGGGRPYDYDYGEYIRYKKKLSNDVREMIDLLSLWNVPNLEADLLKEFVKTIGNFASREFEEKGETKWINKLKTFKDVIELMVKGFKLEATYLATIAERAAKFLAFLAFLVEIANAKKLEDGIDALDVLYPGFKLIKDFFMLMTSFVGNIFESAINALLGELYRLGFPK